MALQTVPLVEGFLLSKPSSLVNLVETFRTGPSSSLREVRSQFCAKKDRAGESFEVRVTAAELAKSRGTSASLANGDEFRFRDANTGKPSHIASFTKGLRHTDTSQIADPDDFAAFVKATDSGDELLISNLKLGPKRDAGGKPMWRSDLANKAKVETRGWESMSAGLTFDLQGPDAQAIPMPPAPTLASDEFIAEAAEVTSWRWREISHLTSGVELMLRANLTN